MIIFTVTKHVCYAFAQARKMTHAVMAKEVKHITCIEDLRVSDSVKVKAKDYIRRYMVSYPLLTAETCDYQHSCCSVSTIISFIPAGQIWTDISEGS